MPLKLTILTDERISRFLHLWVGIETKLFELSCESNDMNTLCILVEQAFQRCDTLCLTLCSSASEKVVPLLNLCKPCLPYITYLMVDGSDDCTIEDALISSALTTTEAVVPIPMTHRLANVRVRLCLLPTLFSIGALGGVTSLEITFKDGYMQNMAISNLPEILSSMTCLEILSIEDFETSGHFDFSGNPKVKSETLHTIGVQCSSSDYVLAFLAIFSRCPVRTLDADSIDPCLEGLSELFPHLKDLTYVSESGSFPVDSVVILIQTSRCVVWLQ